VLSLLVGCPRGDRDGSCSGPGSGAATGIHQGSVVPGGSLAGGQAHPEYGHGLRERRVVPGQQHQFHKAARHGDGQGGAVCFVAEPAIGQSRAHHRDDGPVGLAAQPGM